MSDNELSFQVNDLDFFYGSFQALLDINLDIKSRSVTALIGPSGCGKSTFLRCLNRMNDTIPGARVDGQILLEGEDISLLMYDGEILDIEIPPQVKMKVTEAAPGIKGNTATGATKKVTVETGLEIEVPLFINEGENVIVDTRTGEYVSRTD